eukprot:6789184-Pyramimonas_sp.AAC.1
MDSPHAFWGRVEFYSGEVAYNKGLTAVESPTGVVVEWLNKGLKAVESPTGVMVDEALEHFRGGRGLFARAPHDQKHPTAGSLCGALELKEADHLPRLRGEELAFKTAFKL